MNRSSSLALVKETETRKILTTKLQTTLSGIKTKTREDIQTLNKYHQKSLSEQTQGLKEQIDKVRNTLSKIIKTQENLERRFEWNEEKRINSQVESRKNRDIASQLRSTTWQIALAVLLLVSILSGVLGWFLHQQLMN